MSSATPWCQRPGQDASWTPYLRCLAATGARHDLVAGDGEPGAVAVPPRLGRKTAWFAPITRQEVDAAERIIGRPLPELLRRICTEVGNEGFGPDAGIASPTTGRRAPGHLDDRHSSVRMHERNRIEMLPSSWLYLVPGGCTTEWHVSLPALDNPVLLFDVDEWEPSWGEDPHDGLRNASPPLRHWLWTWARGGDDWAQVHDRA
ncbi:hypothetical protein ACWCY6_41510 [Streptomyces sp. 900105755]